jgi:DNA-binding MarR family transcriptional regulator
MQVSDPQALRALSHPLRLDLVELLAALGPATAAECARQLGTSHASCSFHLRQLAKYGFVEQAPDTGDRRERPWQLTDIEQSWSTSESRAAGEAMERTFLQREFDRLQNWSVATGDAPAEWRDATFISGATLPVTAEELVSVGEALRAAIAPYVDRLTHRDEWPDNVRFVRVFMAAAPVAHLDPDPPHDQNGPTA